MAHRRQRTPRSTRYMFQPILLESADDGERIGSVFTIAVEDSLMSNRRRLRRSSARPSLLRNQTQPFSASQTLTRRKELSGSQTNDEKDEKGLTNVLVVLDVIQESQSEITGYTKDLLDSQLSQTCEEVVGDRDLSWAWFRCHR